MANPKRQSQSSQTTWRNMLQVKQSQLIFEWCERGLLTITNWFWVSAACKREQTSRRFQRSPFVRNSFLLASKSQNLHSLLSYPRPTLNCVFEVLKIIVHVLVTGWRYILTSRYLWLLYFFCIVQLRLWFYVGSLNGYLVYHTNDDKDKSKILAQIWPLHPESGAGCSAIHWIAIFSTLAKLAIDRYNLGLCFGYYRLEL